MAKGKQVYARIESEKTIVQLAEECERRDISRPDFVREAIELHLKKNALTDVIDARDKLKKQLSTAQAEVKEWGEAHAVEYNNCEEALKKLKVAKQEIERLSKPQHRFG